MQIRDAVRISMSIPIFFEPVKDDSHVFVDGGLADNFPLHIFDSELLDNDEARWAGANMKTLGLFLQEDKTKQHVTRDIKNMKDFMGCLLDTVKMRISQLSMKPGDENRILFIQTHYVSSTNFSISNEEKDLLIHEGQRAARKFYADLLPAPDENSASGRLVVQLLEGHDFKKSRVPIPRTVFCVLKVGEVARKSSTRFMSANPVWHENFVFRVNPKDEVLQLQVYDSMRATAPKLIGSSTIRISDFPEHGPGDISVVLEGAGKVSLKITYSAYK